MMLKDYLTNRNISIYRLAKEIEEPYSTLNDLANGKIDIDECKVKLLRKIAVYFGESMEEMHKVCKNAYNIYSEKYKVAGTVDVKLKTYHIHFNYEDVYHEIEFCKVTEHSSIFIEEAAVYEMEKMISKLEMEKVLCSIF